MQKSGVGLFEFWGYLIGLCAVGVTLARRQVNPWASRMRFAQLKILHSGQPKLNPSPPVEPPWLTIPYFGCSSASHLPVGDASAGT
jgi:hypothetical protein